MSPIGELRDKIAVLTQSDGVDSLPGFNLSGFQSRFPMDAGKRWGQKCGAIDTLCDIEAGLIEFFQRREKGIKPTFFEAFGFLQGLVVQQDAALWLGRAMGFHKNGKNYPLLGHVRNVRNRAVGHPAYSDKETDPSSGMWSPAEISVEGFSLTLYYDGDSETRWINFRELLTVNESELSKYLVELIDWMHLQSAKFSSEASKN